MIRFWAFLSLGGSGLITKEEMRSSSFKSLCYISPLSFLSPPSPPPSLLGFRKRKRERKRFGRKLEEEAVAQEPFISILGPAQPTYIHISIVDRRLRRIGQRRKRLPVRPVRSLLLSSFQGLSQLENESPSRVQFLWVVSCNPAWRQGQFRNEDNKNSYCGWGGYLAK